jgi:hypothetical protein
MSALGHNRTFGGAIVMSALPPKADMCDAARDVRFGPIADIARKKKGRQLWAISGHWVNSARCLLFPRKTVRGPLAPESGHWHVDLSCLRRRCVFSFGWTYGGLRWLGTSQGA